MRRCSTPAIRERACELREQGCTISSIAKTLGFSEGAVEWWLLKHAADKPDPAGPRPYGCALVQRSGRPVRPFLRHEDDFLLQCARQGLSHAETARRLTARDPSRPRGTCSVMVRQMRLARHQEQREAA